MIETKRPSATEAAFLWNERTGFISGQSYYRSMKPQIILCLALVLNGGWLPLAHANLGETFNEINARYGQPVKLMKDPDNDTAIATYEYEFNNRKIYVDFMAGKSSMELVHAPADNTKFSDEMCLAMAKLISGETNWAETQRDEDGVVWAAGNANANLQHGIKGDLLIVSSIKWTAHEMQFYNGAQFPFSSSINEAKVDTKAAVAARVLKSHQELAEQGDRYGEYRMGLRYRDGDGVPQDLDKAREWLQKSADQGDTDAATELAKLSPKPELKPSQSETPDAKILDLTNLTILSAEFGMGKQVTNVTARVIELLHDQPKGFTADAKSLGADPLPGKKKHLVVRYDYKGGAFTFTIPAAKEMSYQSLVKNASK